MVVGAGIVHRTPLAGHTIARHRGDRWTIDSLPAAEWGRVESQRTDERILRTLTERFTGDPVSAAEIADELDLHAVTVRDHMRTLRTPDSVESHNGPRGGYQPTASAYRELEIDPRTDSVDVPVSHGGSRLEGVALEKMAFVFDAHPERIGVEAHLSGDLDTVEEGDEITFGPIPPNSQLVHTVVYGRTADDGIFLPVEDVTDTEEGHATPFEVPADTSDG